MKVLLVDDDQALLTVFETSLSKDGFEVIKAEDGKTGLEMARAQKPDFIFLDQILPDMKGNDVLKALKADEATKSITVAMLSNFGQQELMQEALAVGAVDYILKYQVDPADLSNKIKTHTSSAKPVDDDTAPVVAPQAVASKDMNNGQAQPQPTEPTPAVAEPIPTPTTPVVAEATPVVETVPAVPTAPVVESTPTPMPEAPSTPSVPPTPEASITPPAPTPTPTVAAEPTPVPESVISTPSPIQPPESVAPSAPILDMAPAATTPAPTEANQGGGTSTG